MATLLPPQVLHALPPANLVHLLSKSFFPNLIASPFMVGLHAVFYLSAFLCLVAAVASMLRGKRYIHGQNQVAAGAVAVGSSPTSTAAQSVLQEGNGPTMPPRSSSNIQDSGAKRK